MGTRVKLDNYLPMRDVSHDSNGGILNGHNYCGSAPITTEETSPVYDREVLKQTMLEQEATFRNQVHELHRLYHVQRDLMDEVKRKEQYKPYEASSSSSPLPPQMQPDAQKCNALNIPLENHVSGGQPAIRSDIVQSSFNAKKGESGIQAGPILLQNISSPKGSEASDARPTNHRRKMLDLELPAEECIDTDVMEQCGDGKLSGHASDQLVDRHCSCTASERGAKIFPSHPEKVVCNEDASGSSSKKSVALADLNEPLQVDEMTGAQTLDLLSSAAAHDGSQQQDRYYSNFLGLHMDAVQNPKHGNLNMTSNNSHFDGKGKGTESFPYVIDPVIPDRDKGNMKSINQGVQPEKPVAPSQPVQLLLDQAHRTSSSLSNDLTKADPWRTKTSSGLEASDRSFNLPHVSGPPSFIHSSVLGNSREHSLPSWGKPASFMTQTSPSVKANPFLASATLSRISQSFNTPNNAISGSTWHMNGNAKPNSGFGTELPLRNGFYHGCSSSGFKEPPLHFPSVGCDLVGRSNNDKSGQGSTYFTKAQTGIDINPTRELNLNVAQLPPNGFPNEWTTQQGVKITDSGHKQNAPLAALPWFRTKDGSKNEASSSRNGYNLSESSTGKISDHQYSVPSFSYNGDVNMNRHEIVSPITKKIMGVPIFDKPSWLKSESSSVFTLPSWHYLSKDEEIQRGKKRVLDMNAPCDLIDLDSSDSDVDGSTVVPQNKIRNNFDLNSCIIEDEEAPSRNSLAYRGSSTSTKLETDTALAAPLASKNEDNNGVIGGSASIQQHKPPPYFINVIAERLEADRAKSAAEAIVSISSIVKQKAPLIEDIIPVQVEAPSGDPLSWFVDIACSFPGDFEQELEAGLTDNNGVDNDDDCLSTGSDYLEKMTLQLTECTPEEYMPKPFIPELPLTEDTRTSTVGTRPRRGQARRGRQRRDFQRDILPGLVSLSRHEVTEDLQTFGSIMRASGHAWQCSARRNASRSGSRGRRRVNAAAASTTGRTTRGSSKQQSDADVALEWGKSTRRPRRQRGAAGNPTSVTLA